MVPAGNVTVGSAQGSHKVLSQVNDWLKNRGQPAVFQLVLVGFTRMALGFSEKYVGCEAAVGYAEARAAHTLFKHLTSVIPLAYRATYCRRVSALAV